MTLVGLYAAGYALQRLRDRSVRRSAHDRFADLWDGNEHRVSGTGGRGAPARLTGACWTLRADISAQTSTARGWRIARSSAQCSVSPG